MASLTDDFATSVDWWTHSGNTSISGGVLTCDVDGTTLNSYVLSNWYFDGDFDVQVDFSLTTYPDTNGWYCSLDIIADSDSTLFARATRQYNGAQRYAGVLYDPTSSQVTSATSDTIGKLRITRVGNTFSTYYWNGSSFTLLKSATHTTNTESTTRVRVRYYNAVDTPVAEGDFDNFAVNSADAIIYEGSGAVTASNASASGTGLIIDTDNTWILYSGALAILSGLPQTITGSSEFPQATTATVSGTGTVGRSGSGSPTADTATATGAGVVADVTGSGAGVADTATASGAGHISEVLTLSLSLTVDPLVQEIQLPIELEIYTVDTLALSLSLSIIDPYDSLTLPLSLSISDSQALELPIELTITDANVFYGSSASWTPKVILGGSDITSSIYGDVVVEAEEGVARIADFSIYKASGAINLTDYVGVTVLISATLNGVSYRLFTGIVDVPTYDPILKIISFSCTDNLQEIFESSDNDVIANVVGGYYHDAIFGESLGWDYAQNRLSTIPYSFDLSPYRISRLTAWESKATADYTFNESRIIDNTFSIDIANRRNIVNKIDIDLAYSFTRLKERVQNYNWRDNNDVCRRLFYNYGVPSKETILNTIESTGWEVIGDVVFTDLPPTGLYLCFGQYFSVLNSGQYASGVTFSLGKRYTQGVKEQYSLEVISEDSIDALGVIRTNKSYSAGTEYNSDEFLNTKISETDLSDFGSYSVDVNNDKYIDQIDGTARTDVLDTAINSATTEILKAHRNNFLFFDLPLNPQLDLIHTCEVDTTRLDAKGKVSKLTHILSTTGASITQVRLSLSKRYGLGLGSSSETVTQPESTPEAPDAQQGDLEMGLYIRTEITTTPFSENWSGWITNSYPKVYTTYFKVPEYPQGFVIHTPAVTDQSIDATTGSSSAKIYVTVPDDTLTMTG